MSSSLEEKDIEDHPYVKWLEKKVEDAEQTLVELKQKLLYFLEDLKKHCYHYANEYVIFENDKQWKGYCHKDLEEKIEKFAELLKEEKVNVNGT